MHILLLGNSGQLGWELQRALAPLGTVTALDYPEIDLGQPHQAEGLLSSARPSVVVNASAYTAVDGAEEQSDLAMAVNGRAPGELAEAARRHGTALIHYSTDYVFDGTKGAPYTEQDAPNPLNVYGRSKLAGEQAIQQVGGAYLILRTSWVYSLRRQTFVNKVLAWSRQRQTLRIVNDQVSNPTWSRMLAEATAQILAMGLDDLPGWIGQRAGLYHLAGAGHASRHEWAQAILELDPRREEQVVRTVQPAQSAEFPTPARRPLFSALNCDRFTDCFNLRLPHWKAALGMAMAAD